MRQLPNMLTVSRLVATVPVVALVFGNQPGTYLAATFVFAAAALTDFFDGRIARRYSITSKLGVFLDLTADKVFVSGVLIGLIQAGLVPAWIVIVIVTREFLVAGLRSLAAAGGVVIPAGRWGKQKTLLTLVAIGGILLAKGFGGATAFPLGLATGTFPTTVADYLLFTADAVLILAVVWTIFSGVEYVRGGWKLLAPAPA